MKLIGIDEAGVGPIIGPMVVAGVLVKDQFLSKLQEFGVKDSKKFSLSKARQQRLATLEAVRKYIKKKFVQLISAEELDNSNFIDLEILAIIKILEELDYKTADIIYIPQIGQVKLNTLINKINQIKLNFFTEKVIDKIIYEIDADDKFLPVSLASIIAKTRRDAEMIRLCESINEPYISGYPNKKTAEFLYNYYNKYNKLVPQIRKSRNWEPLQKLLSSIHINL